MFKQRLKMALAALVLLASTFGGGVWYGNTLPKGDVDPQDYIETVFTPYQNGLERYLEFLDGTKKSLRIASACSNEVTSRESSSFRPSP